MPEKCLTGPVAGKDTHAKEAVCIHTKKIYDACRDKDCLEDLRVYMPRYAQDVVDKAVNVKARRAELIWVYIDVESVSFNRGFYTVDVKYFYKVILDVFTGVRTPVEVSGLATFDKRVILFGSEGNAKIFTSQASLEGLDNQLIRMANMPAAIVEVVDPICLNVKLADVCECNPCGGCDCIDVPESIAAVFDDELVMGGEEKRVYCTLGQFSIIRLERDTQLVVPVIDVCLPDKECISSSDDNPCDLFRRIKFPVDEFFPPNAIECNDFRDLKNRCV
ncbi:MAG: hypothetical protein LBR85_06705 [Oscillospiraceae bacterium]|jgi:hypothetical protein|nr:hypothetical protein [Oscillospiraceae bacterium]